MTFFCFFLVLMESEGAVEMFTRSVETRNLTYKIYVGDGGSKAYSAVRDIINIFLIYFNLKSLSYRQQIPCNCC